MNRYQGDSSKQVFQRQGILSMIQETLLKYLTIFLLSQVTCKFNPNFFFLPQKNFAEPTPTFLHSISVGFDIQTNIPSTAPTQQLNPAVDFL